MPQIAIIGHPHSGLKPVLNSLIATAAVVATQPSRRQGLAPAAIHTALCKAHDCTPLHSSAADGRLQPVQPGPLWAELALDLMLANQESTRWAWADPQAIHLLEHWSGQDPQAHFVLVYAPPHTAFAPQAAAPELSPPADPASAARQWLAFNTSLLHFALRQPQRCTLLGHDPAQSGNTLADLHSLLGLPAPGTSQPSAGPDAPAEEAQPAQAAATLAARQLAQQHPDMADLYAQLQAAANLPLHTDEQATARQHQLAFEHLRQASTAPAMEQAKQTQQDQEQLQELQEENDLLLQQLHLVQEELERYYLKNKELEQQLGTGIPFRLRRQSKQAAPASQAYAPTADSTLGKVRERLKATLQARHIKNSPLFDATWYLQQNPDIARTPAFARNPALHYLMHGADEGRDPSPSFSTWSYLHRHPDVARSGLNPLLHYILHGKPEGRSAIY